VGVNGTLDPARSSVLSYTHFVTIAILRIHLRLPSRTLKEKRTIVRSVVERLRNRFNAAVTEAGELDTPAFALIAAVCISNDASHAEAQAQAMAAVVEEWRLDAEILEIETEHISA